MYSTASPKTPRKNMIVWLTLFVIGSLILGIGLRIQDINAANAPINLLEGVQKVGFSYNTNYLKPQYLYAYTDAQIALAKKKMAIRPKTYIAGSKSDTIKEEFPSADFLFDMDSEVYRAVQAEIQEKGWRAMGSGGSECVPSENGRATYRQFNNPEETKLSNVYPSDISVKITVYRRFESGKCLFYISAYLAKSVLRASQKTDDVNNYCILLTKKSELIIVREQDDRSSIKEEVRKTVSSLLGKSATQFTGMSEVTNE